jgi:hypothetical protein
MVVEFFLPPFLWVVGFLCAYGSRFGGPIGHNAKAGVPWAAWRIRAELEPPVARSVLNGC